MISQNKTMNSKKLFTPRNDLVLIQVSDVGESEGGVVIPQTSLEGKQYTVVAMGPKVEDLKIDDRVLVVGTMGVDWDFLPMAKDLFIVKQTCVVLVYNDNL